MTDQDSAQRPRILIVDDDDAFRQMLKEGLQGAGYATVEAGNSDELRQALKDQEIALVTLDIGLRGEDGLALCLELRSSSNIPVILVTGRGDPIDRVTGLEHGADDYVSKPFHIRELILRIERVLSAYKKPTQSPARSTLSYRFRTGTLDVARRQGRTSDDSALSLTDIEFRLLELLLRHAGRILSRDELSLSLRGHPWNPLDRTLDGHVARLRSKIEPAADEPVLIKSVRGVGYVFADDVETSEG